MGQVRAPYDVALPGPASASPCQMACHHVGHVDYVHSSPSGCRNPAPRQFNDQGPANQIEVAWAEDAGRVNDDTVQPISLSGQDLLFSQILGVAVGPTPWRVVELVIFVQQFARFWHAQGG